MCKVGINFQMEEGGRHFENLPMTGALLIETELFVWFVFSFSCDMPSCAMGLW